MQEYVSFATEALLDVYRPVDRLFLHPHLPPRNRYTRSLVVYNSNIPIGSVPQLSRLDALTEIPVTIEKLTDRPGQPKKPKYQTFEVEIEQKEDDPKPADS